MRERAELLRMLSRIRRRARALATLEGAVAGATLGLAAVALGALVWRLRGGAVSWRGGALAAGALAAFGAALGAGRPISLVRCARLLDAALDRGGAAGDRVLSALSFSSEGAPGNDAPLARAALGDAVARARALAPAVVAPARRPRALPALGGAALVVALVGAWPARAPGARLVLGPRPGATAEARVRVAGEALDAERAELAAATTTAEREGDVSLAALAREAQASLDALAAGALGRGEALERLTALAARAKEAAEDAEAGQAAARAAGKTLEPTAATRALGHALGADDPEATQRALDDLATRAGASEGARDAVASAMSTAASGLAGHAGAKAGGDDAPDPSEGRRHLNRDQQASGEGSHGEPSARRLEHLRRDLEDTAAACHGDTAACANRLRNGNDLTRAAREGTEGTTRRRLESAVQQLRERLRRGDLDEGARGATERRFARVARGDAKAGASGASGPSGQRGASGQGASGKQAQEGREAVASGEASGEGQRDDSGGAEGAGEGSDDVFAEDSSGAQGATAETGGAAQSGDGAGHAPGGEPLGTASTPPTRGRQREVRVRDGVGPTRSEVIEASARRGFAAHDYVRVFGDYQPVVEESLTAGAVPEGRRYVVRRYFQLIRPRAARAP